MFGSRLSAAVPFRLSMIVLIPLLVPFILKFPPTKNLRPIAMINHRYTKYANASTKNSCDAVNNVIAPVIKSALARSHC